MKIYICGGSSEMDLVAGYMRDLRDTGHSITHDWIATIRSNGDANPRVASNCLRAKWATDDLRGIERADIVWVILPIKPSLGCAFEAGYVAGFGDRFIISGDWRATIFSSRAFARFDEHDRALKWLQLYGTPGEQEDEMKSLEDM
jgi:hypothetical protein